MGPDLTSAGAKYSPRDLLESILEPSKVVSDQYVPLVETAPGRPTGTVVSPMPHGLADVLSKDELLDLLALIISGGAETLGAAEP